MILHFNNGLEVSTESERQVWKVHIFVYYLYRGGIQTLKAGKFIWYVKYRKKWVKSSDRWSSSQVHFEVNHRNIIKICCIPLTDPEKRVLVLETHNWIRKWSISPRMFSPRAARADALVSASPNKFTTFSLTYVRFLELVFDALSNGGNFNSWKSLFQKLDIPE